MSEMKIYSQRIQNIVDHYCLFDDNFMTMFFCENYEAAELVLNIILERDDLKIIDVKVQVVEPSSKVKGRSVRLDVLAKDQQGKNYNIEVQRDEQGAIPKRARFNSSMLDSSMLHSGDDYTVLKESYVIFITENDVMGGGLPLYHIDRYCFELDERFNDGNHIIYVNGAYHDLDTPIGKLMHDFKQTQADQMYYQILKERYEAL